MIVDTTKLITLPVLAAGVGAVAWSGEPRLLPIAVLFPALWAFAPSRLVAVMVAAGYFLAASRGLPQGVVNFYGSGFAAGIALWFGAAASFILVHGVLWTARPGIGKSLRYGLAAILMSVPPFGIVGWAHPITAAGVLFPGWGWWGLAATAIGLLAMTIRTRLVLIPILAGFWIWSTATWTQPVRPRDWIGIDTHFGGARDEFAGYAQHLETIAAVTAAARKGYAAVVLPEGAAGMWTPTAENLWRDRLAGFGVEVNAGAIIVDGQGYNNVMLSLSSGGGNAVYHERMPVPVSMWQPWRSQTGQTGGAQAHFFDNPIATFAGRRVAPLICYEQLLVWPVLQSLFYAPDVIVATGNDWWTTGTGIIAIQRASTLAWARLFDLPLVMAFNN